ncbi:MULTISPECIES: M17 family metallopeptidase [unclassified Thioalkalivibrio]|uniref:leucyl aminopeptidase family protein n=1 Tax=unclassified Thioalkalivibrio TaxID=2621013 RepID=UPI0003625E79|nr:MULTISPECIES: leucyl aminopeptidase family protein [unclassified Thioalkalivibrio]
MDSAFVEAADDAIDLVPVTTDTLESRLEAAPPTWRAWAEAGRFEGKDGQVLRVPGDQGQLAAVLVGFDAETPLWMLAAAAETLATGHYRLVTAGLDPTIQEQAAIGWGLGCYRFDRYRAAEDRPAPRLVWPEAVHRKRVMAYIDSIAMTRDLINTPAADMMPANLALTARELAEAFGCSLHVVSDSDALEKSFPCVYAVGEASAHGPRVIELTWGPAGAPSVVLVGKGVCFDSGGLNLKPGNSMRQMKKDMGGAAIVLGLARLIMATELPVRLTVLIGAVENAVGSRAFRPGDVLTARNGKTIEVDNTDAEGRLVLADLLDRAGSFHPDLLVDFATLTGAARVAVGTEISAVFASDENWANALEAPARAWDDPVCPLPLHAPYRYMLDSDVADIVNSSTGGYAGAITAGLFLKEFVPEDVPWLHFDIMAFNVRARPGRPKGGEAMGLRALHGALEERYASQKA